MADVEEVNRNLTKLENRVTHITDDVIELEKHQAVLQHRIKESESKISSFNDKGLWLFKLIVGAVILAVLGFALKGGLVL